MQLRLFGVLLLSIALNHIGPSQHVKDDPGLTAPIEFHSQSSTFLYCTKASTRSGDLKLRAGNNMTWKGNAKLGWVIDVPKDGQYELYLIANVRKAGGGQTLVFTANAQPIRFQLQPTQGPYPGGRNFERTKLSSTISLKKGTQQVTLTTAGVTVPDILMDIRSIELLPLSAQESIEAERQRAYAARASTDWMVQSAYGLMFHWTSQSVQPDGSRKTFQQAVNDFDVDRFADMVQETGAGYVIFTIGHAEQYCPAPLQTWEKLHPGRTTQRDLIGELANALHAKDARFICYLHSLGTAHFGYVDNEVFFRDLTAVLTEMGNRYQEKLAGYWFDCWYQIFEGYPEIPFETFCRSTKIGHAHRVMALNSWIYPPVTPWQDYWAG